MPLKLNSSGGGSVTVQEPSTASNRTLTLPDATTTAVGTDATQTLSNKTFSGAQTFGTASLPEPSGSAPLYLARAWVNFNGTGTVAIRASGNVSSITDNGTGDYTLNFTAAMSDANYAVSGSANDSGGSSSYVWLATGAGLYGTILRSTTQVRVQSIFTSTNVVDVSTINVAIFR
jgi:hypothetical protein